MGREEPGESLPCTHLTTTAASPLTPDEGDLLSAQGRFSAYLRCPIVRKSNEGAAASAIPDQNLVNAFLYFGVPLSTDLYPQHLESFYATYS